MYHHPTHVVDNINPCNSVSASFIIPCILSLHCLVHFICHHYNASKAQSLSPGVRRCWLRKHSPVYIDYFCLYCILSGLRAGRIISLIGVGFVVLFAHILPIVKPFFLCSLLLCKPSFSLRIVPSLSSSSSDEVDSLRSFLYCLILFILFLHFNPLSTFSAVDYSCIAWRLLSPHHIQFSLLLDLTVTRTIRRHFHLPVCALISPCLPLHLGLFTLVAA